MKRHILLAFIFACTLLQAQTPDTTLLFAHRDTCDLRLDFYRAAPGRGPCADTLRKPVIRYRFLSDQSEYQGNSQENNPVE